VRGFQSKTVVLAGIMALAVIIAGIVAAILLPGSRSVREQTSILDFRAGPDGHTLSVRYSGPGDETCARPGGVVVSDQTSSIVRLEAFVNSVPQHGERACTLAARIVTVQVQLTEPLGNRRVVDASTDRTLSATPERDLKLPPNP
jgi:hypothetical protein